MSVTPFAIVFATLAAMACRPEFNIIRPTMIRLASGDSVLFVATGPYLEPQGDTGMMYEYHPFIPMQDTLRLRAQALDLWKVVKPRADSLKSAFVVLLATTRYTELRGVPQPHAVSNYGFVIERRGDGRWYLLNTGDPVPN